MKDEYRLYMNFTDGSQYCFELYPEQINSIEIKIEKDNLVLKRALFTITFDGCDKNFRNLNLSVMQK